MTVTRDNIERILVARCGYLMNAAGLDGSTDDGTNTDLNDPIGYALRKAGYTVDNLGSVDDDDLSGVDVEDYDQVFDLAELRTLENILGNLDDVDIKLGPRSESLSQLSEMLDTRVMRLQAKIERQYGVGLSTLEAGVITLDFADHNEDLPGE